MLNSNEKALIEFVQDYSGLLPTHRRIKVYLGLADMLNDGHEKDTFHAKAEILEAAERECAELDLKLPKPGPSHDGQHDGQHDGGGK